MILTPFESGLLEIALGILIALKITNQTILNLARV